MGIESINNRNTVNFGNGLTIYTSLEHQTRYKTHRPYIDGLLKCPADRIPTFQFKCPEEFDGLIVERLEPNGSLFGLVSVGTASTNVIIRKSLSGGEFLYFAPDKTSSLSSPGIFYLAFRLASDPPGEYRYFSEQWQALNPPCLVTPDLV